MPHLAEDPMVIRTQPPLQKLGFFLNVNFSISSIKFTNGPHKLRTKLTSKVSMGGKMRNQLMVQPIKVNQHKIFDLAVMAA